MHGACVQCHKNKVQVLADKPMLDKCVTCHREVPREGVVDMPNVKWQPSHGNRVVLPGIKTQEVPSNNE
jgi:hypothetical protein